MVELKKMQKIMMIGAGPAVIGPGEVYEQAGLQACRILREQGIQSVVLGSDPASLVTEAGWADRAYCEPLTVAVIEKIILREQPDGLLISFGGQNALNLGYSLVASGILEKHRIPLLGFPDQLLAQIEERGSFVSLMNEAGIKTPAVSAVQALRDGVNHGKTMGFPVAVRTPLAMEGLAVNLAYNQEELAVLLEKGLSLAASHPVWLEESLLHWREIEVEALRDREGRFLVAALVENIDPVGIHGGDSMVVTPPQGLPGAEITNLSAETAKVLAALDYRGAANLQWAWNPQSGELRLLRLNPRFTRSAALAAQATGLPLAAVAMRLLLGDTLPQAAGLAEFPCDSLFRPRHSSVAVRLPRFDTAKFPDVSPVLTTVMKATGEIVAVGGNFREALQKGVRSLEVGYQGLGADRPDPGETEISAAALKTGVVNPVAERLMNLRLSIKRGLSPEEIAKYGRLAEWFVREIAQLVRFEKQLSTYALYNLDEEVLRQAKRDGFSDAQIAYLLRTTPWEIRQVRARAGITPAYREIAPLQFYATYEPEAGEPGQVRAAGSGPESILLVGSGPSRIGQGPEYNYCAAYAARSLRELGYSCVYVNCNPGSAVVEFAPETVSYLAPLTAEELLNIVEREKPVRIITQFSGVNGAGLAAEFQAPGSGCEWQTADMQQVVAAERYQDFAAAMGIALPGRAAAVHPEEAALAANRVGFPVALSPERNSGIAEVAYYAGELTDAWERILKWGKPPLRIEHLPDNATGYQVNGIAAGSELRAEVIVEQIEEALVGVGDSACAWPANNLQPETAAKLTATATRLVREFQVKGLVSFLFAVKHGRVYLREFKSGDCQLVPFIQKTYGPGWVKSAIQALLDLPQPAGGAKMETPLSPQFFAVKEAVFSFENFPGVDTILGPEQRSTGAVLGLDSDPSMAFIKAQLAAGENLPSAGNIFLGVREEDKRALAALAKQLVGLGFGILADMETAEVLGCNQIPCREVPRLGEGRPDILDRMKNGEVQWIINTPAGRKARREEALIRSTAVARGIPITTTLSGAQAAAHGLEQYLRRGLTVKPLREYDSQ